MKYELAKQLKDAGYPQNNAQFYFGAGYTYGKHTVYEKHHCDSQLPLRTWIKFLACPTLEELIEACGDDFNNLERGSDEDGKTYWHTRRYASFGRPETDANGKTPTEAVARLWLVLNQEHVGEN